LKRAAPLGRLPAKAFVILAVILRHFRHSERKHELKTASHGKLVKPTGIVEGFI